jgi:hypothetical protein
MGSGARGRIEGRTACTAEPGTPVSNLFVQLMNCIVHATERFADNTGR